MFRAAALREPPFPPPASFLTYKPLKIIGIVRKYDVTDVGPGSRAPRQLSTNLNGTAWAAEAYSQGQPCPWLAGGLRLWSLRCRKLCTIGHALSANPSNLDVLCVRLTLRTFGDDQ